MRTVLLLTAMGMMVLAGCTEAQKGNWVVGMHQSEFGDLGRPVASTAETATYSVARWEGVPGVLGPRPVQYLVTFDKDGNLVAYEQDRGDQIRQ